MDIYHFVDSPDIRQHLQEIDYHPMPWRRRILCTAATKEQFYTWSEQAREKKEACETGKLPRVEFIKWLKEGEV